MNVEVKLVGPGTAVIALEGRLDLVTSGDVRQAIEGLVAAGHSRLVVDLVQVQFIDSSGLGALIGVLKAARVAGGDLRLARVGNQVQYVLGITLLDRVLHCHGTVEEALACYT